MRIEQSEVLMRSMHHQVELHEEQEHLQLWNDRSGVRLEASRSEVRIAISNEARQLYEKTSRDKSGLLTANLTVPVAGKTEEDEEFELSDEDKRKIQLIERFIETLTGKKVKLIVPKKITLNRDSGTLPVQSGTVGNSGDNRVGWGLVYDRTEHHIEAEQLNFAASGVVKTADGREISFHVQLDMQRYYESYSQVSIRAGDAKLADPLVINLGTLPATLTERKFTFDLTADGIQEQIAFVGPGSGFLALDLNDDGAINDGRELFGALSGNGFDDLGTYDRDGNHWIDENDPIFDRLQIWMKDESGADRLMAIGQAGIGAIYLGAENTAFVFKNPQNDTQGRLRRTGLYLRENGTTGTLQQVDLAI